MGKYKYVKTCICLLSVFIVCITGYKVYESEKEYNRLINEQHILEGKVTNEKKEYSKKKQRVQEELYKYDEKSKPLFTEIAQYNKNYQDMAKIVNVFFSKLYTWKSSEEYIDRKNNLKSVAEDNILQDTTIFDDGKDDLGGNYIKISGLQSELLSAEVYLTNEGEALVEVTFSSWFDKNKNKYSEMTKYYLLSVNKESKKIRKLDIIS